MIPPFFEALLPLGLIATFIAAQGGLQVSPLVGTPCVLQPSSMQPVMQGVVQHACYGKPKPTGVDEWDRLLKARDERQA
jgi:hypothetical protein